MPHSDIFQILMAHDRWATLQMLDAVGKLPEEHFRRRFEIGPGSLHDTLTHMIAAMRAWTETLAGIEAQPRIDADGIVRSPAQLRELFEQAWQALADEAARCPLEQMSVRRLRDGREVRLTRGAVLTHVTTHGMHHRAQCLNMFRQLGVKPLPPSSVAEWTIMGEATA